MRGAVAVPAAVSATAAMMAAGSTAAGCTGHTRLVQVRCPHHCVPRTSSMMSSELSPAHHASWSLVKTLAAAAGRASPFRFFIARPDKNGASAAVHAL